MILARRRFLFAAPAIIVASNLMPGHSIAHLLNPPVREFDKVMQIGDLLVGLIRHEMDVNRGTVLLTTGEMKIYQEEFRDHPVFHPKYFDGLWVHTDYVKEFRVVSSPDHELAVRAREFYPQAASVALEEFVDRYSARLK